MADKYENMRRMSAAQEEYRRNAEVAALIHKREQEIWRLRCFLQLIAEPLSLDILSKGDFKEIAQTLSQRVQLAGRALNGAWPEQKQEEAKNDAPGIRPAVLHVVDSSAEQHPESVDAAEIDPPAPEVRLDAESEGDAGKDIAPIPTA